ncbi:MAG: PucR family transcriptional regulator [Marmoricola sp.]
MASVSDLLGDTALALRAVHLPHPDADVRWVAVSELADPTPFLEGGEILLTTALEMTTWDLEWDDYIRRLVSARVCALGLGVDLSLASAPPSLLSAAERWGLNVLEIPRRTTFVAVSRAVADLVRAEESRAAQHSLEIHQALTRAAARSDEPDDLLMTLADALGGTACLVSVEGRVQVGPVGPKPGIFAETLVAEEVARIQPRGLRAASSVPGSGGTLMVQPIGVHGRPARYLAVGFEGSGTLVHRAAIAAAVVLLNLAEEHRHDRLETRRKLAARAIELLIHGDRRGAELLLGAIGSSDAVLPSTCLMLRAAGPAEDVDEVLDRLDQGRVRPGILAQAVVGGELVVLGRPAEVRDVAAIAARRLRTGLGRSVDAEDVVTSYRTAGLALAGAAVGAPVTWREQSAAGVAALLEPERARAFAEGLLLPLRAPEDAELLETLGSFLRHHGSHVRVARDLGIHRNTVAQRVRAIEARLGRSLDDPQTRVDLWTALHIANAADSSAASGAI